jgi:hypothetical protein
LGLERDCKLLGLLGIAREQRIAKPLYGLTPVPRVRIHPSPPRSLAAENFRSFASRNTRTTPVFRDYPQTNRTAENGLLGFECSNVVAFLRKANAQSGFEEDRRRTQCDQKLRIRRERVDLRPQCAVRIGFQPTTICKYFEKAFLPSNARSSFGFIFLHCEFEIRLELCLSVQSYPLTHRNPPNR